MNPVANEAAMPLRNRDALWAGALPRYARPARPQRSSLFLRSRQGRGGRTWYGIADVFCLICFMALGGVAEEAELPIRGMRIPLELFEDGRVKMQFSAAQARVPEGMGEVEASGALLESFNADGSPAMVMEADRCWYNRTTGRIDSDGPVRMDRGDMEVTGVGMEWEAGEQKLRLFSNVRVVLKGGGLGKVLPEKRTAEQPNSRRTKEEGAE